MTKYIFLILIAFTLFTQTITAQNKLTYPTTQKVNQIDTYFGTEIADPYRWLEDTDSPETAEWVKAQNEVTFDYLSKIPFRDKVKKRLTEIWNYPKYTQPFKAGEYYFFYKNDGLQNLDVLYIQKGLDGVPEVFIDPNTLSEDGSTSLSGTSISKDNKYLAYSLSKSGSDINQIYVMEIATKKQLPDMIDWVKFSGASWFRHGFFYGTYQKPDGENELTAKNEYQKVYYHKLGTKQSEDSIVYKDDSNPLRGHYIWASEDEKYLFLSVFEQGKKGNQLYFKNSAMESDSFSPISVDMDFSFYPVQNYDSKVYFFTNKNAPNGKVVAADLADLDKGFSDVLPETDNSLDNINIVGNRMIAIYMIDVTDKALVYDLNGKFLYEVKLPSVGNVFGFEGKKEDKIVFYGFTSMISPPSIYMYDIEKNESRLFRSSEVKFNPDEYESKQVFYSSKDGTKIPMFLVYKKGLKLDGNNPAYLYGYGGFSISMKPAFSISRIILIENGGVFAMPCIRGGGEYGEKWHEAGTKLSKQNVFDDFIAAAEYLIREKYTSPEKLAVAGGSNGGLLVGAVMNQRPELFRVCLPAVGVMDMLRYNKFTIGQAWSRDYGTAEDSDEMFKYLLGYSPLHNIREGVNYPATMVTTADHDDRVVPSHSFKYISTLQEKYNGSNPVIIRVETKAGHGSGKTTEKFIDVITDEWSFIFYNMGITPVY